MCLAIHSINMIYFNTDHKSAINRNFLYLSCLLSILVLNLTLYKKQQFRIYFIRLIPKVPSSF